MENADLVIVRFGDSYKQWNAALGKPYITLHDEDLIHPLKEVDGSALVWARTPEQVVELLYYVTGRFPASL